VLRSLTSYDRSTVWYISVSSLPLCDWRSGPPRPLSLWLKRGGPSLVPLAVVEASRNMMPMYLSSGPCPRLACLCLCPTGCLVRLSLLALRKPGRKKRGASQSRGAQSAQCQILLANFTNICALRLLFWPLNFFFIIKTSVKLSAISRI
jgi:hypothetical protein